MVLFLKICVPPQYNIAHNPFIDVLSQICSRDHQVMGKEHLQQSKLVWYIDSEANAETHNTFM